MCGTSSPKFSSKDSIVLEGLIIEYSQKNKRNALETEVPWVHLPHLGSTFTKTVSCIHHQILLRARDQMTPENGVDSSAQSLELTQGLSKGD